MTNGGGVDVFNGTTAVGRGAGRLVVVGINTGGRWVAGASPCPKAEKKKIHSAHVCKDILDAPSYHWS